MDAEIFARNVPGMTERLGRAVVGIAGCGGLGSNAAVALARAGIGKLILVDHDRVEPSNLNRQHFFANDIGRLKVDALAGHLRTIHREIRLATHAMRLTPEDLPVIFREAHLLIEAFDRAEDKHWLIQVWCREFPQRPIVAASGLGGYGRTAALAVRSAGMIHVCGDGESDMSLGLCAARVALVAAMQANVAIELLMDAGDEPAGR